MKFTPAKKNAIETSTNVKRISFNPTEDANKNVKKTTQKGMGEQSKKIFKELIPLIRFCKEKEVKQPVNKANAAAHKKSFSISPNVINNPENSKTPNKTVIHIHQKSSAPIGNKLECPTFDAIMEKADKIMLKPNAKTVMGPQKNLKKPNTASNEIPAHRRTKSDCLNANIHKFPAEKIADQPPASKISGIVFCNKREPSPLITKVSITKKPIEKMAPIHKRCTSDKVPPLNNLKIPKDNTKEQITQKDRSVSSSIAKKISKVKGPSHERSVSTQIKINTYLQDTVQTLIQKLLAQPR